VAVVLAYAGHGALDDRAVPHAGGVAMSVLSVKLTRNLAEVQNEVFREGNVLPERPPRRSRNIELVKSMAGQRRFPVCTNRAAHAGLRAGRHRRVRRFSFIHGGCVQTMRLLMIGLLLY